MNQVRSELLKLRTVRTVSLLLLATAGLTLLGSCLQGLSNGHNDLALEHTQRGLFGAETSAVFFATIAGLIAVTSEFRYGTIRPTLLFEPRRHVVIAAKLAACALVAVLFAVVGVVVSFAAGLTILAARDYDLALSGGQMVGLALGTLGASVLSAMAGVAIGTLIRNQAGAIISLAAYAFAVDATLFAAAPSVGRYLPGKAGDALAGMPDEHLLAPGFGAAVIAAWALAFIVAATVRTDRSDV